MGGGDDVALVEDAAAVDLFTTEPEFLADEIIGVGDVVIAFVFPLAEAGDALLLANLAGYKQLTVEIEHLGRIGTVDDALFDFEATIGEPSGGDIHVDVFESESIRQVHGEAVGTVGGDFKVDPGVKCSQGGI